MQLKRSAKLLTVIGLTTKHAISHNIHAVSNSFVTNDYFPKLIRKIISTNTFLQCFTLRRHEIQVPIDKKRFESRIKFLKPSHSDVDRILKTFVGVCDPHNLV